MVHWVGTSMHELREAPYYLALCGSSLADQYDGELRALGHATHWPRFESHEKSDPARSSSLTPT